MQALEVTASDKHSSKVIALTPTVSPARKRNMLRPSRCHDTAPKPLQGFTVTAPVQILEHNTGCWWERTITARIRDGSTIPVVLDHVYWNWITGTPMHIHLDGIQRIRVIEDKHHQREENN